MRKDKIIRKLNMIKTLRFWKMREKNEQRVKDEINKWIESLSNSGGEIK